MRYTYFFSCILPLKKKIPLITHYMDLMTYEYSWNHNLKTTALKSSKQTTYLLFQISGKDLTWIGWEGKYFRNVRNK